MLHNLRLSACMLSSLLDVPYRGQGTRGCGDMTMPLLHELTLTGFFISMWCVEKFFSVFLHLPAMLGHLIVGIVFGPSVMHWMGEHVDTLDLLGRLGVILLVIETGLAVDIIRLRSISLRATLAAFVGVVLPCLLAYVVLIVFFDQSSDAALAVGAAIAPSSVGVAAEMLKGYGLLESAQGQLAVAASVVDDVISLFLLAEVDGLSSGDESVWRILAPFLGSIGSVVCGCVLTVVLQPRVSRMRASLHLRMCGAPRPDDSDFIHTPADSVILILLFLYAGLLGSLCQLCYSSELLGAFFAGLAFSSSRHAKAAWCVQIKPFTRWGSALFFAATIGFGFPRIESLMSTTAVSLGVMLLCLAMVGKSAVGFFALADVTSRPAMLQGSAQDSDGSTRARRAGDTRGEVSASDFCRLSWSMQGRGEFSYLIRDIAQRDGILGSDMAAAVVWALFLSTVIAPIGLRCTLNGWCGSGDDPQQAVSDVELSTSTARRDERVVRDS